MPAGQFGQQGFGQKNSIGLIDAKFLSNLFGSVLPNSVFAGHFAGLEIKTLGTVMGRFPVFGEENTATITTH